VLPYACQNLHYVSYSVPKKVLWYIFNGLLTKRLGGVVVLKHNAECTLIDHFRGNHDVS